jgi:hypothetical protein
MVPTQSRSLNASVKFSPGLPQNDTCGCWAGHNHVIEVSLNESRIVSGLFLDQTTRKTWLKDVAVVASGDNVTFLDWGNYSASNFTEASTILFPLPVRARVFRITVFNYIHHYINHTAFPFSAQAFVSDSEPFSCGCPMLSSGECCPRQNMRVWEDQCFSCMDNNSLNVMMVDECGICKPGTVERWGKCVAKANVSEPGGYTFNVGTVLASFPDLFQKVNDSRRWTVQLEIQASHAVHSVFLIDQPLAEHPCVLTPSFCCLVSYYRTHTVVLPFPEGTFDPGALDCQNEITALAPNTQHQFQQYDRGRYSITMSARGIWDWALCLKSSTCTGFIGVLFAQTFPGSTRFVSQVFYRPLEFEFVAPPFMVTTNIPPPPRAVSVNFRRNSSGAVYAQISGVAFRDNNTAVRWDYGGDNPSTVAGGVLALPAPEPKNWSALRMEGWTQAHSKVLFAAPRPRAAIVQNGAVTKAVASMVTARIGFGFSMADTPEPGDSNSVMTFVVNSEQVRRLKRLAVRYGSASVLTVLTTAQGAIKYPEYVVDMGIACSAKKSNVAQWLAARTELIGAERQLAEFINRVCVLALDMHNRVFVMVPLREVVQRDHPVFFEVQADFG